MTYQRRLLCGAAVAAALIAAPAMAQDQVASIDIAAQPMASALKELARQSGANVLFAPDAVKGLQAPPVQTSATPEQAARLMLAGTDLTVVKDPTGSLVIRSFAQDPQGGSAAGVGAEVEALIVTAQKREEDIQDVPIAISAFSQKALDELKIEGGFDLLKAIPNVTFSKNNFTGYNFSIRGIGTKAVSATTDPGVAVSFNNIALLQNRLFEQEYFDVERVEVLRGPQGTLYGRNATAGVINIISAKPDLDEFKGWVKGEVGNYDSKRASAMVNVPLIEDKLAVRIAGAFTDRQGYDFNTGTGNAVNGRDLWSARISVGFNPTESIRSTLIWERFEEDDNRSRTGKQLCHHDSGPSQIGPYVADQDYPWERVMFPALFSQGCKPGSLYDDAAFGTPNGLALPFLFGMLQLGENYAPPYLPDCFYDYPIVRDRTPPHCGHTLIRLEDPYGGMMQSRDLREIQSFRDPIYRAKADVVELNIDVDLSDRLTFSSQTAYNKDSTYSFQDFNRFNTLPIFRDTAQYEPGSGFAGGDWSGLAPGGILCDPQVGCSNSIAGFDLAQAKSRQFTQEFRLQSDFDGSVNFSLGSNYTRFDVLVDYYVFFNALTALAQMPIFNFQGERNKCTLGVTLTTLPNGEQNAEFFPIPDGNILTPGAVCPYIDPNPIESIDGQGHNYFRSKNPYHLKSGSLFGEVYWQVTDALKVTAGLRYNDDHKRFTPVPSQVLTAPGFALGTTNVGYPEEPDIKQRWGEFTGRLGLDWKPQLSFTDDTMVYAFYSRGYKGGGANPPGIGFTQRIRDLLPRDYGPTFEPEFVDAFELGAKNTLLSGALTLNGNAFFYDYKDYQVSQIKDRTAVNENFDARTWGLELQSVFAPSRNLQIIANIGYLDTKIGKGETSIDIMNRTQGDPNYLLAKPWVQFPSNCVAPKSVVESWLGANQENPSDILFLTSGYFNLCGPNGKIGAGLILDPNFSNAPYDPANYPEINGGAGLSADLGGNELPNAPHWTANIGAQYGVDILEGWWATIRSDAYWQSQSWARVYNLDPYDKLHGWYNVNLSLWLENDDGLKIELYAKNLLDKTPITDAFLNSDDTALTTNVFVLDPRLIGLSIRKEF